MQTPINWIKYEGKTEELQAGEYFVYGGCIKEGKLIKELRLATFEVGQFEDDRKIIWGWKDLDSFIIEYIAPLSEIEEGIEEEVKQK